MTGKMADAPVLVGFVKLKVLVNVVTHCILLIFRRFLLLFFVAIFIIGILRFLTSSKGAFSYLGIFIDLCVL
jgi:hypothetical protein